MKKIGILELFGEFDKESTDLTSVEIMEIDYHIRTNTPFNYTMNIDNYDRSIVDYVKLRLRNEKIEKIKNRI